jgi:hypothetical protein
MKARKFISRSQNNIRFEGSEDYPKYMAICKGETLPNYEIVTNCFIQTGDYFLPDRVTLNEENTWIQAVGAVGSLASEYFRVCRPKRLINNP